MTIIEDDITLKESKFMDSFTEDETIADTSINVVIEEFEYMEIL